MSTMTERCSHLIPRQIAFIRQARLVKQSKFATATLVTLSTLLLVTGCSYTPKHNSTVEGSAVGVSGDLSHTHVALGAQKHMLTVTAAPGLMETEGSIAQRIHIHANMFAAKNCPNEFVFVHDPNFDQSIAAGFMKRTRTYVFICK